MSSKHVTLTGSIPNIKPADVAKLSIYAVRGKEILASSAIHDKGAFRLDVSRKTISEQVNQALEVVVGPAGLTGSLPDSPAFQRVRLNRTDIAKADKPVSISKEIKLTDEQV